MRNQIKTIGLFFIVIFFFNTSVLGQEISTRGEIYNFEIGDVFHYHEYASLAGGNSGYTIKTIDSIIDKFYSAFNDTVYYILYHQTVEISEWNPYWTYDTSIISRSYSKLDSLIYNGNIDTVYSNPDQYNGRTINYAHYAEVLGEDTIRHYKKWVDGCGKTLDSFHDQFWWHYEEFTLEYYKKGQEEWGNPVIIVRTDEHSKMIPNILIFPNPVINEFKIDLISCNTRIEKLELYSITGEYLISQKLKSDQINKIDMSEIKRGLYIIQLISGDEIYSSKIVKK